MLLVEKRELGEQRRGLEERRVLDRPIGLVPERVREVVLIETRMSCLPNVDLRAGPHDGIAAVVRLLHGR